MNTKANDLFAETLYPLILQDKSPVVVAVNLKTSENIGSIIRLAGNVGCRKVLAINEGEMPRISKIRRIAEVAGKTVDWDFCTFDEVWKLIPDDYIPIALETSQNSCNLFEFKFPEKVALFVGNEICGIAPLILEKIDTHLHIPVTGKIKSINVSHAAAICLFEWVRQQIARI